MSENVRYVANWGIIGCGWISSEFAKDLCLERSDVQDVKHSIAAVGSRDIIKAEKFIAEYCPKGGNGQQGVVMPYGSYDEVYNNPNVDIIYIGTLNPSHYGDAKNALEAGKHVLIEKPACLNLPQWQDLCRLAKEKGLYLMEGLWTKFQPLVYELEKQLFEEKSIGSVRSVNADFSMAFYNNLPDIHRTLSYEAAGGPLLDLGAYIILQAVLALYNNPENDMTRPRVTSSMTKSRNNVDLTTCIILDFPAMDARAILTTSHAYDSSQTIRSTIIGTQGEILIHNGLSRITEMSILSHVPGQVRSAEPELQPVKRMSTPFPGFGLYFEADAVARDIRDGKPESERVPHSESALILEILDEVRTQGNYNLPTHMMKVSGR